MGKAIKSNNQQPNEAITTDDKQPNGNHRSTDTEQTETKRKRGRPRKEPAAAAEKEVIPRMVTIDLPIPEEPKTEPTPTKKPKARKTAAKKSSSLTAENVAGVLKATFDVIGNKEGFELWKLDDKECKQIAEPLSKIIQKSSYLERVTDEYGEYIALIVALSTVIIPRLLLQAKINKEKKKDELEKKREKKNHVKRTDGIRTEGNENRTIHTSDRQPNGTATDGGTVINPEFHKSIPVIQW